MRYDNDGAAIKKVIEPDTTTGSEFMNRVGSFYTVTVWLIKKSPHCPLLNHIDGLVFLLVKAGDEGGHLR